MNVGIIGYGKMGQIRNDLVNTSSNCKVVCAFDPLSNIPESLKKAKTAEDIINSSNIDAVFIATPNYLIAPLTIKALEAGKHVFAEKPPGMSTKELMQMKEVSQKHPDLTLKFGFNHRYHDAIMEAKRQIETGKFGEILWMRGRYGKSVDENFKDEWRAKKDLAGGGILLDQGIHMLDLFLHFCGDFDEAKSFCSKNYWKLDIEDNVFALFRNKKGQTASLHSTMTQWRHLFALEMFLERGYIVINGILSSSGAYTYKGGEELTIALNRSPAPAARHTQEERLNFKEDLSFKREVEEFIDCVCNKKKPEHGTIQDAEKLMVLIEKIYKDDMNDA
jgi:predicted dehydrogenase